MNIAQVMNEVTKSFKINNSKISHTVTDNASNFGKAFRTFSIHSETPNESQFSAQSSNNNWFKSSDDESNVEISDSGSEVDNEDVEIVEISTLFSNPENIESISHPKFKLSWVPVRYLTMCKQLFITECNLEYSIENRTDENGSDDNENSDHKCYQILSGDTDGSLD
ncbi:hypothetical protein QTP88_029106 [Uroleucon formosanum]